jgi:hypothetical protein
MSEAESGPRRRRIARILIALFGTGATFAGVGVAIFNSTPSSNPNLQVPCVGEVCIACAAPSRNECEKLTLCGGEPCPDISGQVIATGCPAMPCPMFSTCDAADGDSGSCIGVDPYAGAAGRFGRGLRRAMERGALTTYHTDVVSVADGGVTDCATTIYLDRDQRAAWRRTVDAVGVASDMIDCRESALPAKFKRNGFRRSKMAGMPDTTIVDGGTLESFPDDTVVDIDGGT